MSGKEPGPWYREGTVWLVLGILGATFASGIAMLTLALTGNDSLVISEREYRDLRDEMRATRAREDDNER